MIAVFIHNPHDKVSRDLLPEFRARFDRFEVYDFQALRGLVWVQGAPCVWLFNDGADVFADEPVWRQDIQVDLDEVADAYRQLDEQENPTE